MSEFFTVTKPGYWTNTTTVVSSHKTLAAARKAARAGFKLEVRKGGLKKGDTWYATSGQVYPEA